MLPCREQSWVKPESCSAPVVSLKEAGPSFSNIFTLSSARGGSHPVLSQLIPVVHHFNGGRNVLFESPWQAGTYLFLSGPQLWHLVPSGVVRSFFCYEYILVVVLKEERCGRTVEANTPNERKGSSFTEDAFPFRIRQYCPNTRHACRIHKSCRVTIHEVDACVAMASVGGRRDGRQTAVLGRTRIKPKLNTGSNRKGVGEADRKWPKVTSNKV